MHKPKQSNKKFIDFGKLSKKELEDLSTRWEKDAYHFELKLGSYMHETRFSSSPDVQEKVDRLWNVGKNLWKRLSILETWRRKQK
jgi:hypothetical protein